MNLGDTTAHLAGPGPLVTAGLAPGTVCLIGFLLSAIVALVHLARRQSDAGADGEHVSPASFRWETQQEPGEAQENRICRYVSDRRRQHAPGHRCPARASLR
jgi:hypothetical protein